MEMSLKERKLNGGKREGGEKRESERERERGKRDKKKKSNFFEEENVEKTNFCFEKE
jgi:hypothetical protein